MSGELFGTARFRDGAGGPHTYGGQSIGYGSLPWRMRGRALAVWYKPADLEAVLGHLPPAMSLPPDPVLRLTFWDLEHDLGRPDLVDELDTWIGFQEMSIAIPVRYQGIEGDNTVHMFANNAEYMSFGREIMGWPVRSGDITFEEVSNSTSTGSSGREFRGELANFGHRVVDMRARIIGPASGAAANAPMPTWITEKALPSPGPGGTRIHEIVVSSPASAQVEAVWDAEVSFDLMAVPGHELHELRASEVMLGRCWEGLQLTVGSARSADPVGGSS